MYTSFIFDLSVVVDQYTSLHGASVVLSLTSIYLSIYPFTWGLSGIESDIYLSIYPFTWGLSGIESDIYLSIYLSKQCLSPLTFESLIPARK